MDFNIDPKNIIGVSSLMQDSGNEDISELEKEIINGTNITAEEESYTKQFSKDIERISKTFDVDGFTFDDKPLNNNFEEIKPTESFHVPANKIENPHTDYNESSNSYSHVQHGSPQRTTGTAPYDSYSSNSETHPTDTVFNFNDTDDSQLRYMTREQQKQDYVNTVLQDISDERCMEFDPEKEREEDDKNSLLEQIDMLRTTLEDDGFDLKNIPTVSKNNTMSEIQSVFKILRLKNDRNRYCSFAEEIILSGAYGIEFLFDGKKEWFGRKPDLVGWSQTVKVKMRRMRYTTSTFVQEVMQEYNMSSGTRLMLELIPSMFLYSRQKKIANDDNISSDMRYNEAISNLNSQMM